MSEKTLFYIFYNFSEQACRKMAALKLSESGWLYDKKKMTWFLNPSTTTEENEVQYYISSLPIDVKFIANAIRSHWEVENKAHWVLDVIYKEDASRIRRENAAENLAVIRRLALNLARLNPMKNSMRGKLSMAMWSDEIRHEIVFGQNQDKV